VTWFDELQRKASEAGANPWVLGSGRGRVLTTEHAARVLAVEMPGVEHNLLFHTTLPDGSITGGDRLWLAPEVAYFWPSVEDARRDPKGTARVPPSIDPATWKVRTRRADRVELACSMACDDRRDQRAVRVRAAREFRSLDAPRLSGGLECVRFAIGNTLSLPDDRSDDRGDDPSDEPAWYVGAWDILQVPPVGTLICPTPCNVRSTTDGDWPRSYYDPFGPDHVVVDEGRVRFLIDGRRRVKLGLLPEQTTGRMGYYRRIDAATSSLILRFFAALPGEPYCDLPRDAPDDHRLGGDALQAYNDDGDVFSGTSFGEMEHHDPCLMAGRGPTSRAGVCVTQIVVGPPDEVRRVGRQILGAGVDPIEV
jgi:hypothetical protein